MRWNDVVAQLFPDGHDVRQEGSLLAGEGRCHGVTCAVIGSTDHVELGVELAHAMAARVIATVHALPRRPIVLLVDTAGQRLRRRDELLGIHRYMAHLAKTLESARQSGHRIVGLVYDQALSGGFLPTGMMADVCGALLHAEIRVMNLPAMARVTRIPLERLTALASTSPVFAPGAVNFVRMGAIDALWEGDLSEHLATALAGSEATDWRRERGEERGGRLHAADIVRRVLQAEIPGVGVER